VSQKSHRGCEKIGICAGARIEVRVGPYLSERMTNQVTGECDPVEVGKRSESFQK
jgi:hypothetical protein